MNIFGHNKNGFTLAEVLITLGIIGVVASLTIPTLMQNQQEKATEAKLKKVYSVLSSAYTLAVQENGTPDNWGLTNSNDSTSNENLENAIRPYLKFIKDCGTTGTGCFSPGITYKALRGVDWGILDEEASVAKFILSDGTNIKTWTGGGASCPGKAGDSLALQNICGSFMVDINGSKSPNTMGIDTFEFWLTKYGIVPMGTPQEWSSSNWTNFATGTTNNSSFTGSCADKSTASGRGCTAWIIYNGNQDYLHCSDLAWDGKHQCG
jgi:prepilin-type N-terminal cleavage/methylation domain-containing protein